MHVKSFNAKRMLNSLTIYKLDITNERSEYLVLLIQVSKKIYIRNQKTEVTTCSRLNQTEVPSGDTQNMCKLIGTSKKIANI